ncbi:MAG: tRNA (adenosine(37)-N6)-dimethylallyltransferase MiaA [Firmicutes bacterium]|nr:tRNA (adenosine(37)-N6)-dimethylallyltransferase MiaA [Bacillota bacterium]
MSERINLAVLVGPTAVGKTDISIKVAKELNAEIISADSMQIYKNMNIGTAKIKENEKNGIKHYLIDEVNPDEDFSASDFQTRAKEHIKEITKRGKLPFVVGGTGLYVNSLVYNLDFTNAVTNWELRDKLRKEAEEFGNNYLKDKLKEIDPKSADKIHINDTKRLIRALEVYYETGKPMSYYNKKFREANRDYNLAYIGLYMDRKKLYERINKRVDLMIEEGLIEEVKKLLYMGYDKNLASLQGLGYKEIIKYLNEEYTYDEAIRILKRDSRRFAKRQLTWFKRDKRIHWVNVDDYSNRDEIVNTIITYINDTF